MISTKAAYYPYHAWIRDLESQHDDPDHSQNLIDCFLYHCRAILKIASKSSHDFRLDNRHCDPDHHQTLINCSFYQSGILHKKSSQSIHS